MPDWQPAAAATVIGLAGFQLVQLWNSNAPSLKQMRECDPDDEGMKVQLRDADVLVGGLALILGTTYAYLAKDYTAMIVMIGIYGTVSAWYHVVLNSPQVRANSMEDY